MKFGSVCSGIEAASVAWESLGWKAAWFSEIEPFPSAVLKHHYPDTPNLGDMTALPDRIKSGEVQAPDLFCGGTPCQAFSVAGLRKSLDDARGNLSLTFCEIANAIDNVRRAQGEPAAIVFWENVPGVLNTKDNAFGCFLAGLAGEELPLLPPGGKWTNAGCVFGPERAVAWRVLDAQYFGVAQRRRRVFVVASARDDFNPAAVLLEWEGLRRDSAPSRETGKAVARSAAFSAGNSSNARSVGYIEEGTPPLRAGASGTNQVPTCITVAQCLTTGTGQRYDPETETLLPCVFPTLEANDGKKWGSNQWVNQGKAIVQPVTHSLRGEGFDASEDGTGRGTPLVPVAFHPTQDPISSTDGTTHAMGTGSAGGCATVAVAFVGGVDYENNGHTSEEPTGPLLKGSPTGGGRPLPAIALAVAFTARDYGNDATTELAPTMRSLSKGDDGHQSGSAGLAVMHAMQVRRLTPVECERLQGFPDNYTAIPWRGKPVDNCPDGPRYKALGNSWAVPVVRWIGNRIKTEIECKPKK